VPWNQQGPDILVIERVPDGYSKKSAGMAVAEFRKRGAEMNEPHVRIVTAAEARRALTKEGDIRDEVAFQNDINTLLARLEETKVPLRALSRPQPALLRRR
jgi:hypothetical protein